MNETLRVIEERFSCRSFLDRMLHDDDLMTIAQAAIQSPSGMNRQHWQVIVVTDKALMDDMEDEGMRVLSLMDDTSLYERVMERGGKLFYNAPSMIVIAIKETYPKGAELIDCGILAQNTVIAASSLGLATLHCGFVSMAFAGDRAQEFKERLQFPDGYEPGMGVLLGYASDPTPPHVPDQNKITLINSERNSLTDRWHEGKRLT